jgi:hypothetical protein
MFNILITGEAPVGYIPLGSTTPLIAKTLVHWQGTVEAEVGANNIIELNAELTTLGDTTITDPVLTGDLEIAVSILPWGTIGSSTIQM